MAMIQRTKSKPLNSRKRSQRKGDAEAVLLLPCARGGPARFSEPAIPQPVPSFPLRPQPETRHEFKGLRFSGHEKSAIVKADRDPTIFAALDYFADATSQRYLGSPCESFSDQPDSIARPGDIASPRAAPLFPGLAPSESSSTCKRPRRSAPRNCAKKPAIRGRLHNLRRGLTIR